jgi:ammonium transporter
MDTGDSGFMLICAALVMIMTPGLAFFYGGLERRKNVLNTMMQSFFVMGICSVMWVIVGYSLSFSGDNSGLIGTLHNFCLYGMEEGTSAYASTIPPFTFVAFQMMFALITPALITGSVAGRMNFKALFFFIVFWSLLIYYPLAHMVWGHDGLLGSVIGALDFAGGDVVHISSGVSGLVLSIMIGKRQGYSQLSYHTHNIPFVLLGAALLWFGWYGFNAGSALSAGTLAAHAFITTNTAAASAMASWMAIDCIIQNKPTVVGASTGAVLGLVAITPGAGFVPVWSSVIIGLVVSPLAYFMITTVKKYFGYDDALDAFGCHGIGGIWGGIATGLFTQQSINPAAGWDGLVFSGNFHLMSAQLIAIGMTIVIAAAGTFIIAKVISLFVPLRVGIEEEKRGLDMAQHGESAYPSFNGLD